MRIKSIKSTKELTTIVYEEKTEGGWNKHTKESPDPIGTDFIQALEALVPDLLEVCEESTVDRELVTVTGVSCSYKTEFLTLNIIITGYKSYKASNGVMNMNSPFKAAYNNTGAETASENLVPNGCYDRFKTLVQAAMEYVEQDYSQIQMEFDAPDKTDPNQQDGLEDDGATAG